MLCKRIMTALEVDEVELWFICGKVTCQGCNLPAVANVSHTPEKVVLQNTH